MKKELLYFSAPGVVCAAGMNSTELWHSVVTGNQTGIRRVPTAYGRDFYAARIDDSNLVPSSARYDMRIIRIEEKALNQIEKEIKAAEQKYGADRVAVCVGSCDNGTEFSVAGHREYFSTEKFPADYSLEMQGADYVATFVSEKYRTGGPSLAFCTSCSSSAGALIKAAELIRAGSADAVIAGGVDIASDTVLLGFESLGAVSPEITNPFSINRHGITIGEGAAFFVLSKDLLFAGTPVVTLAGYGESADAYHMTSPDPEGTGAEKAIAAALFDSGLVPEDIGYVNLHGTGTKFNDSMEAKAVCHVFGDYQVPCSTTKPLTGHTLGAAAALEAAVCWETLIHAGAGGEQKLPVQVWDGVCDPDLPAINIVSNGSVYKAEKPIRYCMSNSFAFGGSNASLIMKKGE
jgi:3-oxoacyl-[acyl-carrier-protein] synthase I